MKLPSISYILLSAKESFLRFPLTILSACIVSVISVYMIENADNIENVFPLMNICLTFALGISLYLAVSLFAEKNKVNNKLKWGSFLFASIILLLIHNSLPASEEEASKVVPYINFTIYSIISHLLVAFLPYYNSKQENGFWNYNKGLFIRFATVYLYSLVLFAGLVLSLVSLNLLFDVDIHDELIGDLWMVIAVLFSSWFFVSGIPENLDDLEQNVEYPRGLKTFGQYILLPLLMIYFVILYAYGTKIIIQWDWPKGIVTYMISVYSVLGVFTFLILNPWGKLKEPNWVKKFSKWFYVLMIPLIVLLFMALSIRISEYGITINRYLVLVLGVWLSIVSLYFSIGKTNIKFVPTSLAAVLILMMVGPWGMFSVSEKSQSDRLIELLEKNDLLLDGKIINEHQWSTYHDGGIIYEDEYKNQDLIDYSDYQQVNSIVDYLSDYHDFSTISTIFKQNIDSLMVEAKIEKIWIDEKRVIMNSLGLDNNTWNYEVATVEEVGETNNFTSKEFHVSDELDYLNISGFDFYIQNSIDANCTQFLYIEDVRVNLFRDVDELFFSIDEERVNLELKSITDKLLDKYRKDIYFVDAVSPADMSYKTESEEYIIKVVYKKIHTVETDEGYEISNVDIDLFLKKKEY